MAITPTSVTALTGALLTGTTTWGPITPAAGAVMVQVVVDRTGLALLTQPLSWALDLSLDAGATWLPWGGASSPAGQLLDVNLNIYTECSFTKTLPTPANASTRLRGSITTLEPLTTTITVRQT